MSAAVSLDDVLSRNDVWRGNRFAHSVNPAIPSGFAALDAELSGGGWAGGSLTELLSDALGHGECSFLLPTLLRVQKERKFILLVAPPYRFNGPAWASAGVDLARTVIVNPSGAREALWVTEQGLASGALGLVVSWVAHADERQVRRLQVAVAGSAALAFLFRPARTSQTSSPAPLRLLLQGQSDAALKVQVLKRRGPPCNRMLSLNVLRPIQRYDEYETSMARAVSAVPAARSQRVRAIA